MRQIQQLTQALMQILFRKENKQYAEALEDIQRSGELFLGLDLHAVEALSYEQLQEALRVNNAREAQYTSLVAELLHHQGDCFLFEGLPEAARRSYSLALDLYLDLFVSPKGPRLADLPERIDQLLETLNPLTLDPATQWMLFRYFDAMGRYADAENILFYLADEHPTDELFTEGLAFFERLLRKSHRYLTAGNLPYAEVKDGLAAFRQKMSDD